jgi:uncharacterized protein YndB with AHSA1/START domain
MSQQRDSDTPPTIERSTDLDMDVDELWQLISTAEGWREWLVDEADIDVSAGSEGSTSDAGIRRDVHIDHVHERRQVDFVWWERDDPSSASHVQLQIVELPDGRSQLRVAEQFVGASTNVTMSAEATLSWDVRMVSLWLLALHSTVMA